MAGVPSVLKSRGIAAALGKRMSKHYQTYDIFGKTYFTLKSDISFGGYFSSGREYEPFIKKYMKDIDCVGKTIIDCGANLGIHTMLFSDLVGKNGKVIACEMQRVIYYQLCANLFANACFNVDARLEIVDETSNGFGNIKENLDYIDGADLNVGDVHAWSEGLGTIQKRAIDDLNLDDVSVIKMDIQGYEIFALEGARKTIEKCKPVIFIEIYEPCLRLYGKKPEDVFDWFKDVGYEVSKIDEMDYLAKSKECSNV